MTVFAVPCRAGRAFRVPKVTAAWPIQGLIKHFRPELGRRIAEHKGRELLEAAE